MKQYEDITIKTAKKPEEGIGEWVITITANNWKDILQSARNAAISQLEVPGFRKGKIPNHLVAQHLKESSVLKRAGDKAIEVAYKYSLEKAGELDVKATSQPDIKINDLSQEKCQLVFSFDLPLEVKIGSYFDLDVKKPEIKITSKEIDDQIKILKDRFAIFQPKEKGSLAVGDVAVMDFVGTIDGEEFPGGKAENFELEIGSNRFIPGFEEQMVGMKTDDEKSIIVSFPADYHVAKLANKPASFAIKLKAIKTKIVNDDLEELVKDVNIPQVTNPEELKTYIKEQLTNQQNQNLREKFITEVLQKILAKTKIVIPRTAVLNETERLFNEFKNELKRQNVTLEDYQKMTGLTNEAIHSEIAKDALWKLQTFIILEEVMKAENITASEEEINNYLLQLSQQFNMPIEKIKENIKDLSMVASTIARNKTLDLLWEKNGAAKTSAKK